MNSGGGCSYCNDCSGCGSDYFEQVRALRAEVENHKAARVQYEEIAHTAITERNELVHLVRAYIAADEYPGIPSPSVRDCREALRAALGDEVGG